MSELREYQRKMLNSKKNVVICNWKRGSGKTFACLEKILDDNVIEVLFITNNVSASKSILEQELINRGYSIANNVNKNNIIIFSYKSIIFHTMNNVDLIRGSHHFDVVIFDDCVPDKIDDIMKYNSQIYMMFSNENLEYICDDNEKIDKSKFKEESINKLMEEFLSIEPSDKNTMRRKDILFMLKELQNMK